MYIKEIKKLENGKNKIILDNDDYVILYYKELKAFKMVQDEAIEEETWALARKAVTTRGKKRVYHLLGKKDYVIEEIRKKLVKEDYPIGIIETILDYFIELGFLNDESYTEKYYRYQKAEKSRRMIEMKLSEKGIPRDTIKAFFETVDHQETEYVTAQKLLEKKYNNKEVTKDDYNKMAHFLAYKGFDFDVIKSVIMTYLKPKD
jgi:regulatory protein